MKLAVPDMVSNSYFPALAAVELGFFRKEGLDVSLELLSPSDKAFDALRAGEVDFVGAEGHGALKSFPEWQGVKLLCAQAQGMYWFLVMRADLGIKRGDLAAIRGRRTGAAPWVDLGLRRLLIEAGIDPDRDVSIAPIPGTLELKVNTGVMAARALEDHGVDGFWANGMGAELAVRRGVGTILLDVRRGDGPKGCFDYTTACIAATATTVERAPDTAAAAIRALAATQAALRKEPALANKVGRALFPTEEAAAIGDIVTRDLPYYQATISERSFSAMSQFARDVGVLKGHPSYDDVVATKFRHLWA